MPCGLQLPGYHCLCDHFGNIITNHVTTQPFAVFGIKDHFHKTIPITGCTGLSGCGIWKFPNPDLISGILCLLFGHSNRCNFRICIGTCRDIAIIDRFRIESRNILDACDAFMRGYMCQRRAMYDIANGVIARHTGAIVIINLHLSILCFNRNVFQAYAFNVGCNANS